MAYSHELPRYYRCFLDRQLCLEEFARELNGPPGGGSGIARYFARKLIPVLGLDFPGAYLGANLFDANAEVRSIWKSSVR